MRKVSSPLSDSVVKELRSGDEVAISGIIYTARDEAHKRLFEAIKEKRRLPFDLSGQIIYYSGPTPTPPGKVIGSCGPTTASRMDTWTPLLLKKGLRGMIGKGPRSKEVIKAIKEYKALYFAAWGGAGALLSKYVKKAELIAFKDLGPEAIYRLTVRNFPVIVINDVLGNDLYMRRTEDRQRKTKDGG